MHAHRGALRAGAAVKLYVVAIETEIVVVADSEEEAEKIAMSQQLDLDGWSYQARDLTDLPGSWDDTSIPFGYCESDDPDRTVGEWIARGAAPKLLKP